MSITVSPKLSPTDKTMVDRVVRELGLQSLSLKVSADSQGKFFRFAQDRRVVTLPKTLIAEEKWPDIRHLFRAIFSENAAVHNLGAQNDWSPRSR